MPTEQTINGSDVVQYGELRASAALEAAGAYAATTRVALPEGTKEFELLTAYTRGAVGGAWAVKIEWYPAVATATPFQARLTNESAPGYSTPTMTVQEGDVVLQSPVASGASAIYATRTIRVPRGMMAFRLSFAETGAVGTPGTLRAWYMAASEA